MLRRNFLFRAVATLLIIFALNLPLLVGPAMSATVLTRVSIDLALKALFENSLDQQNAQINYAVAFSDSLADGNAVDLAQTVFYDQRTVTASANDSLDLAGGLTDAFGTSLTFTKIKLIYVQNTNTTVGDNIKIVRPASNGLVVFGAAGDFITLPPGGVFLWYTPAAAGVTVTAATGDLLDITETGGANSNVYRIMIIGTDS